MELNIYDFFLVIILTTSLVLVVNYIYRNETSSLTPRQTPRQTPHQTPHHSQTPHQTKIPSVNSKTPQKSQSPSANSTLYLLLESKGFNIPEMQSVTNLIEPVNIVKNNFDTVAVIANASSCPKAKDKTAIQNCLQPIYNDSRITNLNVPIEKWISFYFGADGTYCRAAIPKDVKEDMSGKAKCINNKSIEASIPIVPQNCQCTAVNQMVDWTNNCLNCEYLKDSEAMSIQDIIDNILLFCDSVYDIPPIGLGGIFFDYETGPSKNIGIIFENVQKAWATKNKGKLKVGYTGSSQSGSHPLQSQYYNLDWDLVLLQDYTDTTANFYNSNCTFTPNWWDLVDKRITNSGPNVPMICAAGNCIGDSNGNSNSCNDERLGPSQIGSLISSKPNNNLGIWYGIFPKNVGTSSAPLYCSFDKCGTTNSTCVSGCCKNWVPNKNC